MDKIKQLTDEVAVSRNNYLQRINAFTEKQAQWKPAPEVWNVIEITEHLFWAEQGGIVGMWKTLHAIREGRMARVTESSHKEMPVQQIIDLTWQAKEIVPPIAAPRFGGPIAFWHQSLASLQPLLELFAQDLEEIDLRTLAHPHPISGDMDYQQRFEFLAFHINRHAQQVDALFEQIKA